MLSMSPFWGQTQTHLACLSCSITHSLQGLIQHVSKGSWDCQCCYCSLSLSSSSSSSFSPSLLASVLLSCCHWLSAGNRQRRDWSAEVVNATSYRCGWRLCRNQRGVLSIGSFQQRAESCWIIMSRRGRRDSTDEKESFNYALNSHLLDSHIASALFERKTHGEISEQHKCISGKFNSVFPTATNCYN